MLAEGPFEQAATFADCRLVDLAPGRPLQQRHRRELPRNRRGLLPLGRSRRLLRGGVVVRVVGLVLDLGFVGFVGFVVARVGEFVRIDELRVFLGVLDLGFVLVGRVVVVGFVELGLELLGDRAPTGGALFRTDAEQRGEESTTGLGQRTDHTPERVEQRGHRHTGEQQRADETDRAENEHCAVHRRNGLQRMCDTPANDAPGFAQRRCAGMQIRFAADEVTEPFEYHER